MKTIEQIRDYLDFLKEMNEKIKDKSDVKEIFRENLIEIKTLEWVLND